MDQAIKGKGVVILSWGEGLTSWKRLKVGNVNGSYLKQAPQGANESP